MKRPSSAIVCAGPARIGRIGWNGEGQPLGWCKQSRNQCAMAAPRTVPRGWDLGVSIQESGHSGAQLGKRCGAGRHDGSWLSLQDVADKMEMLWMRRVHPCANLSLGRFCTVPNRIASATRLRLDHTLAGRHLRVRLPISGSMVKYQYMSTRNKDGNKQVAKCLACGKRKR